MRVARRRSAPFASAESHIDHAHLRAGRPKPPPAWPCREVQRRRSLGEAKTLLLAERRGPGKCAVWAVLVSIARAARAASKRAGCPAQVARAALLVSRHMEAGHPHQMRHVVGGGEGGEEGPHQPSKGRRNIRLALLTDRGPALTPAPARRTAAATRAIGARIGPCDALRPCR